MNPDESTINQQAASPALELSTSRLFMAWLAEQRVSLAFTTYQAGKLFLLGRKPDGSLSCFERTFERTMGLWSDGQTLWLSSVFQLWRMENMVPPGEITSDGFDRLYVPQVGYTTGDIDIHDLAVDADGRLIFVNTLFGCLATVSQRYSFEPIWKPPFLSRIAAEDRCHLNGLAMEHGRAKYVTACGRSDVVDGWRNQRTGGGCVVDVASNDVICEGLSMPHSPRLHDGRLWLLNSGTGFLGYVDLDTGHFEEVTFCPGYARGLTFHDHFAIVGLSKCRKERTFSGLPLEDNLMRRGAQPDCGIYVIDLRTGDIVHWFRLTGVIEELYDVVVLPNVVRPKALGFKTQEIRHNTWMHSDGRTNCWSSPET
jgi:uncharacterized protein (TIGR03032 family)